MQNWLSVCTLLLQKSMGNIPRRSKSGIAGPRRSKNCSNIFRYIGKNMQPFLIRVFLMLLKQLIFPKRKNFIKQLTGKLPRLIWNSSTAINLPIRDVPFCVNSFIDMFRKDTEGGRGEKLHKRARP